MNKHCWPRVCYTVSLGLTVNWPTQGFSFGQKGERKFTIKSTLRTEDIAHGVQNCCRIESGRKIT